MDDQQQERVSAPQARAPMPALMLPAVRGEAVVLVNAEGEHYGWTAWTDIYHQDGADWVDVVPTRQFWMAELLGAAPRQRARYLASCVYVP